MQPELTLSVSEFVAYLNQTLEVAYPYIEVVGEVSSFRVSKGRWVYFDLKDEGAVLRCFTTVYGLPGPLEDGMMVRVAGSPRLHPLYNFTFNVQSVTLVGEGALRRQADLLRAKLEAEGLFDPSRKRVLPPVPRRVALITASQSAAYADFIKITRARWGGVTLDVYDVQVQGEPAPGQIVSALSAVSAGTELPDVVVLIRGGGSAEDLAAFSDERVVRAVAASRVPTLVAIGHEVDTSLAELAADLRASTPSNAAELLFPDKSSERRQLAAARKELTHSLHTFIAQRKLVVQHLKHLLSERLARLYEAELSGVRQARRLLTAYDPVRPLAQGYALVRGAGGELLRSVRGVTLGDMIEVKLTDGILVSQVKNIEKKGK